jgi:hypothetical protein
MKRLWRALRDSEGFLSWKNFALVAIGIISYQLYRHGLNYVGTSGIVSFIRLALSQVALYFLATWIVMRARASRSTLIIVFVFAALFRLSILFVPPHLSDDIYRYIWDGRVQAAGINPYRYIPAEEPLKPLRDETIYPKINRRDYARTIYPPVAQMFYFTVTRLGETVTTMKAAIVACELITIAALMSLLASFGWPRHRVLVYAWHPLLIWETAGSGHVEAVALALVALGLVARRRNWDVLTGIALGLATLIKLTPIVLFPGLYRRWSWKMPVALASIIALSYVPYLSAGLKTALGFLPDYTNEEGLQNGTRFYLLSLVQRLLGGVEIPNAAFVVFALGLLFAIAVWCVFARERNERSFVARCLLLATTFTVLLSPRYAWYFAWLIPFLCLVPVSSIFFLTGASFVTYAFWLGEKPEQMLFVNSLIYVPFAGIALIALWKRRSNLKRETLFEIPFISSTNEVVLTTNETMNETPASVSTKARISVVIPALNEEDAIPDVVRAVPKEFVQEVIVVDNGSDDNTAERAREAGARVVAEPQRGYGRACRAGVHALAPDCEIAVFLDGDGSDCPELMARLVNPIIEDRYDFVIGSRTRGRREAGSMNFQQVFAGRLAGLLMRALYGVRYTDMCPFRAIRRDALDRLGMHEETYGWNLEMQMRAADAGLRILEVPVDHRRRAGGESKVSGTLRGTLLAGTRIVTTFARIAIEKQKGKGERGKVSNVSST